MGEWGICDYITKPRIEAAITGKTPDGEPIKGDYKFTDEFPMADGFEENVEFFTLTYETPVRWPQPTAFARSRRCCGCGPGAWADASTSMPADGWDVADTYGVLVDLDQATPFLKAVDEATKRCGSPSSSPTTTGASRRSRAGCPTRRAGRLYESYLTNFEIRERGLTHEVHAEGLPGRRRRDVLANLEQGPQTAGTRTTTRIAFSLTATTGAGKTVMAAAVFEALFHGDDDVRLRRRPWRGRDLVLRRPVA